MDDPSTPHRDANPDASIRVFPQSSTYPRLPQSDVDHTRGPGLIPTLIDKSIDKSQDVFPRLSTLARRRYPRPMGKVAYGYEQPLDQDGTPAPTKALSYNSIDEFFNGRLRPQEPGPAVSDDGFTLVSPAVDALAEREPPSLLARTARAAATHLTVAGFRAIAARNNTRFIGADEFNAAASARTPGRGLLSVTNHLSTLDDPITACMLAPDAMKDPALMRWVPCAEDICFGSAPAASIFYLGRALPLRRGAGLHQSGLTRLQSLLRAGEWVHIFPEGRVVYEPMYSGRDGTNRAPLAQAPGRWGVGKLAVDAALPSVLREVDAELAALAVEPADAVAGTTAIGGAVGARSSTVAAAAAAQTTPILAPPESCSATPLPPLVVPYTHNSMADVMPGSSTVPRATTYHGAPVPRMTVRAGPAVPYVDLVRGFAHHLRAWQQGRVPFSPRIEAVYSQTTRRVEAALAETYGRGAVSDAASEHTCGGVHGYWAAAGSAPAVSAPGAVGAAPEGLVDGYGYTALPSWDRLTPRQQQQAQREYLYTTLADAASTATAAATSAASAAVAAPAQHAADAAAAARVRGISAALGPHADASAPWRWPQAETLRRIQQAAAGLQGTAAPVSAELCELDGAARTLIALAAHGCDGSSAALR
jgi:hypothetical protein